MNYSSFLKSLAHPSPGFLRHYGIGAAVGAAGGILDYTRRGDRQGRSLSGGFLAGAKGAMFGMAIGGGIRGARMAGASYLQAQATGGSFGNFFMAHQLRSAGMLTANIARATMQIGNRVAPNAFRVLSPRVRNAARLGRSVYGLGSAYLGQAMGL